MAKYEYCLVPDESEKKYHNYKVFIGDIIEVFLKNGYRVIGKVLEFNPTFLGLDMGIVYLSDIKDITVRSRADGRVDWK